MVVAKNIVINLGGGGGGGGIQYTVYPLLTKCEVKTVRYLPISIFLCVFMVMDKVGIRKRRNLDVSTNLFGKKVVKK